MIEVRINRATCQGYGNCVLADPDTFDLDETNLVVLKQTGWEPDELPRLRQAAYDCPTDSISVVVTAEEPSEEPA